MADSTSKPESTNVEIVESTQDDKGIQGFDAIQGYVVDSAELGKNQLKLADDGKTVLIPQPSDESNDPLNWSSYKKHLFLFIIAATAFLPDYGSAVGAVTLLPQAQYVASVFPR